MICVLLLIRVREKNEQEPAVKSETNHNLATLMLVLLNVL